MRIVEHWLSGEGIFRQPTNKHSGRVEGPRIVVLHYTAGTSAAGSAAYLSRPDTQVSAHAVVGRLGEVIQLTPFDLEAWHAGESEYKGRRGLNRCSIGLELDNLGRLERHGELYVAECGKVVVPDEVYAHGDGSYWHRYTSVQVAAVKAICRLLRERYPVRYVVGHSDVTGRKTDPGPALAACGFDGYVY